MGLILRNGNFYIDFYCKGQRIREMVGPDRRLAEKALKVRKAEVVQGKFGLARRNEVRFDAFAKEYMSVAKTNKRSWVRDEYLLKRLLPTFGDRLLSDIAPFLIENYKKKRLEEVKPPTVNREISLLRHILNLAIQEGRAESNPMKSVKLLHEDPYQARFLTQEEITKLLGACTEYSRPIIITLLNTGMRTGECLGLSWSQIDLKQRTIVLTHTKNGKGRTIPINDTLLQTLTALKYNSKSESVFQAARTGASPKCFRTAWLRALRGSGIGGRCRPHDLRHTFTSNLLARGANPVVVKELGGWSSMRMLERYSHSAEESRRNAVALLDPLRSPEAERPVLKVSVSA